MSKSSAEMCDSAQCSHRCTIFLCKRLVLAKYNLPVMLQLSPAKAFGAEKVEIGQI